MDRNYSSQDIDKLIIDNRLEEALEILIETFSKKSLYEYKNSALVLMLRVKEFKTKEINGTINPFDIEINLIRESIIKLTNYYSDLGSIINSEDTAAGYATELLITSKKELALKHIDKFNKDKNLWEVTEIRDNKPRPLDDSSKYAIFEGSRWILRLSGNIKHRIICLSEYEYEDFKDYLIEMKMKLITEDSCYLELNWGAYDSTKYLFRFSIRPRRSSYEIDHTYSGRVKKIKETTIEECINQNDSNILSVLKKQEKMYFYINQKLVHSMEAISLHGNLIGPSIFNTYGGGKGEFEYILIYN